MNGAPLRFLLLVVGGWICLRAAMLTQWQGPDQQPVPAFATTTRPLSPRNAHSVSTVAPTPFYPAVASARAVPEIAGSNPAQLADPWPASAKPAPPKPAPAARRFFPAAPLLFAAESAPAGPPALPESTVPRRWSGSTWLFARRGSGAGLAAGGMLGGSQAGARISYRLNADPARPLALSARLYTPLEGQGAEAALGLAWNPAAGIPLTLLAERRQAVGRGGRRAFSLLAYGGFSEKKVAGPLVADAYGQAGLVGLRDRDLFADGALALGVPLSARVKAGAGLWGSVQPGLSRIDVGPEISWRLPVAVNLRLVADWRFRVAGDAAPASGPALTLGVDF